MNTLSSMTRSLLILSSVAMVMGCAKNEVDPSGNVVLSEGVAKANFFCRITSNGVSVPYYTMNVHCTTPLISDMGGFIAWGPGCSGFGNFFSVDYQCFEANKWYYLRPSTGGNARKFLKFRFGPTYDPFSQLLSYDIATHTWTVDPLALDFDYTILSAKVAALPVCR